jgi:hypothetical protein
MATEKQVEANRLNEKPERFSLLTVYEARPHCKAQADLKQQRERKPRNPLNPNARSSKMASFFQHLL